ncbi:MAG: GNAT family N-acetyltransferase [Bacteroidia bacterium]
MTELALWYFRQSLLAANRCKEPAELREGFLPSCPVSMIRICRRIQGKNGWYELPSGLQLHLVQSFANVTRADWDAAVWNGDFFLSGDFLQAFEQTAAPELSFHYALAYRDGKVVSAMYFQVIHLDNAQLGEILSPLASSKKYVGFTAGWREWIRKGNDELTMRVLISGNNFVSGNYGFGHINEFSEEDAFACLAETVKVITQEDRKEGLISCILIKDFYEIQASKKLRRARYHEFKVEPEMIVAILKDWNTFDDYLADMSKKYRNRAKSVLKKSAAMMVRELDDVAIALHADRLMELYSAVHRKAKFRLSALTADYFIGMKKKFPKQFRFFVYELDGKIVGFRTTVRLDDSLEAHFIGLDYAVNEELALYQRMLYDFVNDSIEARVANLLLGRTAAEIKSTVGAQAYNLVCYIRHRNAFSNQIIRPFIDYLRPSEWTPRSPFKAIGTEE